MAYTVCMQCTHAAVQSHPHRPWDQHSAIIRHPCTDVICTSKKAYLNQPSPLLCAWLSSSAVAIESKESQQQIGNELAHIKGNGTIHCKFSIYGVCGVLSDHETTSVHVPMQQSLCPLDKLGLHPNCMTLSLCSLCNVAGVHPNCMTSSLCHLCNILNLCM